jgi:hypothetical protein
MASLPALQGIAHPLLEALRTTFGARTITDLFVWVDKRGTVCVGLQVNPKLFARFLPNGEFPSSAYIDARLQRAVGFEITLKRSGRDLYVEGGAGQTMDVPSAFIGSIFDGLDSILTVWAQENGFRDGVSRVLPAPSTPGVEPGQPYYSARLKKVLVQERPSGVISFDGQPDLVGQRGLDPCAAGAGILDLQSVRTGQISWAVGKQRAVVTHCVRAEFQTRATADAIYRCGGLLYPSLAIADRPSVGFGRLALFADMGLAEIGVKGGPHGLNPRFDPGAINVYSSDVWTEVTSDFMKHHSQMLYQQAVGLWSPDIYTSNNHLAVLGPRLMEENQEDDPGVLKTWAALNRVLKTRLATYARAKSEADVDLLRVHFFESILRYPYLEAKAHRIVPMTAFPVAVVPSSEYTEAEAWLRFAGFKGKLLGVRGASEDMWKYGAEARDAALWAEAEGQLR